MGKMSRTKGHGFERAVAIELRKVFPNAKRQLEYQIDDCIGVDIANTGKFKIQCKKLRKYASVNTINEVQCAKELGDVPILVTAADNAPWVAILHFDDLLRLIESGEAYEALKTLTKKA